MACLQVIHFLDRICKPFINFTMTNCFRAARTSWLCKDLITVICNGSAEIHNIRCLRAPDPLWDIIFWEIVYQRGHSCVIIYIESDIANWIKFTTSVRHSNCYTDFSNLLLLRWSQAKPIVIRFSEANFRLFLSQKCITLTNYSNLGAFRFFSTFQT